MPQLPTFYFPAGSHAFCVFYFFLFINNIVKYLYPHPICVFFSSKIHDSAVNLLKNIVYICYYKIKSDLLSVDFKHKGVLMNLDRFYVRRRFQYSLFSRARGGVS